MQIHYLTGSCNFLIGNVYTLTNVSGCDNTYTNGSDWFIITLDPFTGNASITSNSGGNCVPCSGSGTMICNSGIWSGSLNPIAFMSGGLCGAGGAGYMDTI